jgi:hypothetical protein
MLEAPARAARSSPDPARRSKRPGGFPGGSVFEKEDLERRHDEEVEVGVAVEIGEERSAGRIEHTEAGSVRHVLESAVPLVPEEPIRQAGGCAM